MAHLHLGVALDGAGWHPVAWREPDARPTELLSAAYWTDLVVEAERGLLDFVTIEDGLALQSDHPFNPDTRTDRVRGRVDAVQIAARVAPRTRHIGLIPTAVTTHTEPFHLSKAIATLDFVSKGRAGVRVQVSSNPESVGHFGRAIAEDALAEAADYVEVLRRLWDSWEDDAEIRDSATGRFIDRDKVHYIDFEGRWFSVKGPSITPRPPQGQPLVAALGHGAPAHRLIASSTDIGFLTPADRTETESLVSGFTGVQLFADLVVFLGESPAAAAAHRERLDSHLGRGYISDAEVFVGTPAQLADLLIDRHTTGLTGFRLRPAAIPHDLQQITGALVPELQRRGVFRTAYAESTLRARLGLSRPADRYAS